MSEYQPDEQDWQEYQDWLERQEMLIRYQLDNKENQSWD